MTSYNCLLSVSIKGEEVTLPAHWALNATSAQRCCTTLDLILHCGERFNRTSLSLEVGQYTSPASVPINIDSSLTWSAFVTHNLQSLDQTDAGDNSIAIKFILPDRTGFCIRSDFLERRLEGLNTVVQVAGFLQPLQEIKRTEIPATNHIHASQLPQVLSYAVGAIITKDIYALDETEVELDNRLSFLWISPSSIPLRRIAYVRGRYNLDHSERIWESARTLGIAVVIIDNEGHWLQHTEWTHLREGFIAANLDPDEGFPERLVDAIRSYGKPIHGITTVSNKRMVGVARACEKLGLPTSPSESFAIAADKFRSREIEPSTDVPSFRVQHVEDLRARLSSDQFAPIQYPVVVKPCIGWGSECISKVHTPHELIQAVERASERHRTSPIQRSDVMIESYVNGPEIDANIVLLDGSIAFFEVADDFPSSADLTQNKWDDPFQETLMLLPSHLPHNEIELIRSSLHQTLLRQGFQHGVFNCEGRIRYSRMKYGIHDGKQDLVEVEPGDEELRTPSFYLHEINARPPGYYGNVASNITYGVDYYALDILCAVNDMQRYSSLAHPFKNGPQWWLVIVVLPEEREGIMVTEDACGEFLAKNEDLKTSVPDYMTWKKGGDRLGGPSASQLGFVGYFSVISRKSREEALYLAGRIRSEFGYQLA